MSRVLKRSLILAIGVGVLLMPVPNASAGTTKRDPAAELYIGWPNNGEVIKKRKIRIWFGLRNMGVAPASVDKENTGHHHLIIDAELPPFDEPIPNDANHPHFGKGQTETVIELTPGKHTLQLIMGDKDHIPHDPPLYSKQITITIQ